MSCGSCVSSLSGFGQEEFPSDIDVSPELVSGMKTSLGLLIGVPVAGSVVGAIGGAVGWADHRVIGGVLGWLAGGAIGGVIGSMLAKSTVESDVLPELEEMAAQIEAQQPGSIAAEASPNSAGPLNVTLPLPASVVAAAVSKSLGMKSSSLGVKAANAMVDSAQRSSPVSTYRLASMIRGGSPMSPPTTICSPAPKSTMPIRMPISIPRLPLTKLASQTVGSAIGAPTTSAKSIADATMATTKLVVGQKMPFPRM